MGARGHKHVPVILWSAENEGLNVSAPAPAMAAESRRIVSTAEERRPVICDGAGTALGASPAAVKRDVNIIEDPERCCTERILKRNTEKEYMLASAGPRR